MSKLIGVVLMVFALTFGMTLTGCKDDKPKTPTIEDVEKAADDAAEEGADAAKEVEKKAEEASPEK